MDRTIAQEQRQRIAQLLGERLSLRGICRTMGVSLTWLLHFMVECFTACPDHLHAQLPAQPTAVLLSRLDAEADERWSFAEASPQLSNDAQNAGNQSMLVEQLAEFLGHSA